MFLDVILMIYLSYRNSVRARVKGLNGWLWAGVTTLSFNFALLLGTGIVVFNFCADRVNMDLLGSPDPKVRTAVTMQLAKIVSHNPLHVTTIWLFGIGGYLAIRYMLERKPNLRKQEIHWMDKLNNRK